MATYIQRELYLRQLIDRKDNGEVKIITGNRRCGKSWLLEKLYYDWLIGQGVPEDHVIVISFDEDSYDSDIEFTDPSQLKHYLKEHILDEDPYYVFLDEIQEVEGFEKIVNGLNAKENIDVYVIGSNSKFLSSDINTLFRGRGDEVRVYPFTFKEFCTGRTEPVNELWKEYYTYGGMPALRVHKTPEEKVKYLKRLWNKTYIDDVVERNHVKNRQALEGLVDTLCSSIGSLTNPNNIANSLGSVSKIKVDADTISTYLGYLENAFLFKGASRYNIKGKKYFEYIKKYYIVDVGLRNARLNFRQQEITHIMENVIFNELLARGYSVDVGIVETREMEDGKQKYKQREVDFIATDGISKWYIQSAFAIPDEEKRMQETASLRKINDSFRKIVIVGTDIAPYTDADGISYMGLFDFLLQEEKLS